MSEHSTEVIQSQLKILIDDFQRYREHQEKDRDADRKVRGEMYKSLNECNTITVENTNRRLPKV